MFFLFVSSNEFAVNPPFSASILRPADSASCVFGEMPSNKKRDDYFHTRFLVEL